MIANPTTNLLSLIENAQDSKEEKAEEDLEEKDIDPSTTEFCLMEYKSYCQKFDPSSHKVILQDALNFLENEISTIKSKVKDLDEKTQNINSNET